MCRIGKPARPVRHIGPRSDLGDPRRKRVDLAIGPVCPAHLFAEECPPGQRIALRPGDHARHWLVPTWYPLLTSGSVVIADTETDVSAERAIEIA